MTTVLNSRDSEDKVEVFALENKDSKETAGVYDAYKVLLDKLKSTKKNVTSLQVEKEVIAHRENLEKIEIMARESPRDVSNRLSEFRHIMNESLTELEVQFVAEQERLVSTRQAARIYDEELVMLTGVKAQAESFDALMRLHREKQEEFEEKMSVQRAMLDRELKEHKQAFELELAQKRRELQQEEQDFIHQRDMARERERTEAEARMRHLEQKEEEFRLSIEHERRNIEQSMQLKFEYEAKLLEKEMANEREQFKRQIEKLEAKIEELLSKQYSFSRLSYNSSPVSSVE